MLDLETLALLIIYVKLKQCIYKLNKHKLMLNLSKMFAGVCNAKANHPWNRCHIFKTNMIRDDVSNEKKKHKVLVHKPVGKRRQILYLEKLYG